MSTDLEQLLRAHIQEARAHIAAAAAWRQLVSASVTTYDAKDYVAWVEAETALDALLGPRQ